MSITDELREWVRDGKGSLLAVADRIDAEHDKALNSVDSAYDSGYNVGYDEGFASADDWLNQHEDAMAEHGWVRLPVDADGVPIRVGDVVDVTPTDKSTGHMNVVVTSVIFKRSAALVTVDTADRPFTFWPNRIRHHHAPTVEDVLREFALAVCKDDALTIRKDVVDEYAAKLCLANSEEWRYV